MNVLVFPENLLVLLVVPSCGAYFIGRNDGREETGRPAMTIPASRRLRTLGRRKITLPFVGRVVGQVQLYGERGGVIKEQRTKRSGPSGTGLLGDTVFY